MRLLASQCVFFDAKGRGIISRERGRERTCVCVHYATIRVARVRVHYCL